MNEVFCIVLEELKFNKIKLKFLYLYTIQFILFLMDFIEYEKTQAFILEAKQNMVINQYRINSNFEAIEHLSQVSGQSYLMNGANFILMSNDNIVQELKDDNEICISENNGYKYKLSQ